MIELDMVYVSYFGDFLSKGSRESFEQNILFRLSPPRKAARPAGKPPGPAWPRRNTVTGTLLLQPQRLYTHHKLNSLATGGDNVLSTGWKGQR